METATLSEQAANPPTPEVSAAPTFDPFGDIPRRDPADETGESTLDTPLPVPETVDSTMPPAQPDPTPESEEQPDAAPEQDAGETLPDSLQEIPLSEYNQLLAAREELRLLREGKAPEQPAQEEKPEEVPEPQVTVKPYRVPEVAPLSAEEFESVMTDPEAFAQYNQALVALGAQSVLDNLPGMVSQHVGQNSTAQYLIHRFIENNPEYFEAPFVVQQAVQEILKENPGANPYLLMQRVAQKLKVSAKEAEALIQKRNPTRKQDAPPPTGPNAGLTRDGQGRFQEKSIPADATEAVFRNWREHESAGEESMRKLQDAGMI